MREYQGVCREALESYEGHIAQCRGDGVLAYFGDPQAHEDDAERAVRGALELQRRLHERLQRGEIVVSRHERVSFTRNEAR